MVSNGRKETSTTTKRATLAQGFCSIDRCDVCGRTLTKGEELAGLCHRHVTLACGRSRQ